jgi:hypothetical protein
MVTTMDDYVQWMKRAEAAEAEVIRLTLALGARNTEAELIWIEENERFRAEIVRHGWSVDCSRCAALVDGVEEASSSQRAADIAKPTKVAYRPNAKYPWLIAQGHNVVKLTERQATEVIQALVGGAHR